MRGSRSSRGSRGSEGKFWEVRGKYVIRSRGIEGKL